MPTKAWAYYSSAADDEITHRENHLAYHRIWFRPRVLRDMTKVDCKTTILGQKSSMPIYVVRIRDDHNSRRSLTGVCLADGNRFRKIGSSTGGVESYKSCGGEGRYSNGKDLSIDISRLFIFLIYSK